MSMASDHLANFEIGDIVEVHLRQTRKGRRGRPVTKCGRVTEIKPDDPTRVRMDTGPGNFRKVLKLLHVIRPR